MAIYFGTSNSRALHAAFDRAIDQGHITTWERDKDGDYTHKAANWKGKLWLRASEESNQLAFYTIPPSGKKIMLVDFAYYHGHLIETFINHFGDSFVQGCATPKGTTKDSVG